MAREINAGFLRMFSLENITAPNGGQASRSFHGVTFNGGGPFGPDGFNGRGAPGGGSIVHYWDAPSTEFIQKAMGLVRVIAQIGLSYLYWLKDRRGNQNPLASSKLSQKPISITPKECVAEVLRGAKFDISGWVFPARIQKFKIEKSNEQKLLDMATCGDVKSVAKLLEDPQLNLGFKDAKGQTALHRAAYYGHTKIIRILLEKNPDLINGMTKETFRDPGRCTALHLAAERGHTKAVEELIKFEEVNAFLKNGSGYNPICLAAKNGHLGTLLFLLDHFKGDKRLNFTHFQNKDAFSNTPLHLAAENGHLEAVKELLKIGDSHCIHGNEDLQTPLHLAAEKGHIPVIRALVEHNANYLHAYDSFFQTALKIAYSNKQLKAVQELLKLHLACNFDCLRGNLHFEILSGSEGAIFLMEHIFRFSKEFAAILFNDLIANAVEKSGRLGIQLTYHRLATTYLTKSKESDLESTSLEDSDSESTSSEEFDLESTIDGFAYWAMVDLPQTIVDLLKKSPYDNKINLLSNENIWSLYTILYERFNYSSRTHKAPDFKEKLKKYFSNRVDFNHFTTLFNRALNAQRKALYRKSHPEVRVQELIRRRSMRTRKDLEKGKKVETSKSPATSADKRVLFNPWPSSKNQKVSS